MPLIQNVEPDLRALIPYIVAGARERRVTLNRTRLVKLLYLVDVESVRVHGEPVTGLKWVFLDFGPHDEELVETLKQLERRSALYRAVPDDAPDGEDWIARTRRTVDSVIERFAALPLDALLDHVYFHTGPMTDAQRGQCLDMSRARHDAGPRRPLPLRAPLRPSDIEPRLAAWRASSVLRLAPPALDPPAGFLEDRGGAGDRGDLGGAGLPGDLAADCVRGSLRVPYDSELQRVHGWIEPFFERADALVESGHIWSAQPLQLPPRHALKIERVDPKDDRKLDFKVSGRGDDTFDHPPIRSLQLASNEAAVLAKATRDRAVIVLGRRDAAQLGTGGEHEAETAMVVPLYAAARYDEPTRRAASRYEFANAFYLPASQRPRLDESIARLDQIQPVRLVDIGEHRGLKLSADALDALVEWFVAFTTNRLLDDSLILEYRRQHA